MIKPDYRFLATLAATGILGMTISASPRLEAREKPKEDPIGCGGTVTRSYWVPARITNGRRGDAILTATSADGGGPAFHILRELGQQYVHSGMLVDTVGTRVRHNTMISELIPLDKNWMRIPTRVNPNALENGKPGLFTESVDQAFGLRESSVPGIKRKVDSFGFSGAVLIKPGNNALYPTQMKAAADKMEFLQGFYRVATYSDIFALPDSNQVQQGQGNMCSGSVWHAHRYVDNYLGHGDPSAGPGHGGAASYSAEARMRGSRALYNYVKTTAGADNPPPGRFIWFRSWQLSLLVKAVQNRVLETVSNQVVNCFAFGDCANTGTRWRNGVGTGVSMSPDNLLPFDHENSYGNSPGQMAPDGVLGRVVPVQKTGGYFRTEQIFVPCEP